MSMFCSCLLLLCCVWCAIYVLFCVFVVCVRVLLWFVFFFGLCMSCFVVVRFGLFFFVLFLSICRALFCPLFFYTPFFVFDMHCLVLCCVRVRSCLLFVFVGV